MWGLDGLVNLGDEKMAKDLLDILLDKIFDAAWVREGLSAIPEFWVGSMR